MRLLTLVIASVVWLAACSPAAPAGAPQGATSGGQATVAAVATAQTGGAPANAAAQGTSTPQSALDKLHAAARSEGSLVWQAAVLKAQADEISQAFARRYPGIQVTYNPMSEPDVSKTVITESSAGAKKVVSLDVAHGSPTEFGPLLQRNMLMSADWASLGIDPSRVLADGKWVANEDSVNLWIYNTQFVSAADAPTSWDDLLRPMFKGKKIVTNASAAGLAQLYITMGEEKANEYLGALKAQELVITNSKGPSRQMVTAGQAYIGISTVKDFLVLKNQGAPVEAAQLGPMDRDVRGWYIPTNVQHPNAAQLFVTWIVSPEGWAAQQAAGLDIATPCNASEVARLLCDRGVKYIDYQTAGMDLFDYYAKVDANQALAQKALGITAQ